MITKLFAVFDSKAGFFGRPFDDQSESSAIRNFGDAVRDGSNPNNLWHKHPEDFSLFEIGCFDNNTGELIPSLPKSLVTASAIQSFEVSQSDVPLFKNSDKPKELIQ